MKQVLRFNKVIKSIIITGDLCILNAVFITVYHMMNTTTLGITFANSLPQLSVLLNLVYLLCNYSKGVVLHRRLVRPHHKIKRAVRNTFFSCGRIHQSDKSGGLRESLSPVLHPVLLMFPDNSYSLPFIIQALTEGIQAPGR